MRTNGQSPPTAHVSVGGVHIVGTAFLTNAPFTALQAFQALDENALSEQQLALFRPVAQKGQVWLKAATGLDIPRLQLSKLATTLLCSQRTFFLSFHEEQQYVILTCIPND